MCGINFILDKKGILDEQPIQMMNKALHHRGPDVDGIYSVKNNRCNLYFSANRLKIMDLSDNGNQPFVSEDEQYVLVFNGEIYNFHDLKNRLLSKGYYFKSSSDTEVLFYALIEYGDEIVGNLNGMFAFVFYDKEKDKIIAARDRSGMKPLYFFQNDLFLIISSEIKGLIASGLVKKELNEYQIEHYLQFRFAKKPETFYKNIFELEEGKKLVSEKSQEAIIQDYESSLSLEQVHLNDEALVEKIEELVYHAFLSHTVSDAKLGLFLSGGVDSTLLLAYAHQERIAMPTFSIVHEKSTGSFGTEDSKYSRLAVNKFGNSIDHHEILVTPKILDELDDVIAQMDQPIGDSATLLTWYLSRFSKNMVKTVLSGAGADEMFAGYNRHEAYYKYLMNFSRYNRTSNFLKALGEFLPTGFDHPYRKKFQLAKKFLKSIDSDPEQTFINFTSLGLKIQNKEVNRQDLNFNANDLFGKALKYDQKNYLISDVLALNDQMGMAHGLELRMPFLDHDLHNFLQTVEPLRLIVKGRKWILKDILTKMGGSKFCNRPKEGFGLPFGQWIRMKEVDIKEVFENKNQIIHKFVAIDQISKMYQDHVSRKADYTSELWAWITLSKWLKMNGFN